MAKPPKTPMQKFGESLAFWIPEKILALAGEATGTLLQPAFRDMGYAANREGIQASPPPDSVIRSFWSSLFGNPTTQAAKDKMEFLLSEHGIQFTGNNNITDARSLAWQSHLSLDRPMLPVETFMQAWRFGGFRTDEHYVNTMLKRMGIYDEDHQNIVKNLPENLDIELIYRLWAARIIDQDEVIRLLTINGQVNERQRDWLLQLFEVPSLAESFVLRNRGLINDVELNNYISRNGFRRELEWDRLSQLRFEIPGPSDLVRFLVRHVFEPSVARKFGFDAEYNPQFGEWIDKQGLSQPFQITDQQTGEVKDMNWARAFWWSHWVWPAPTQAYTMLHRLRASGGENGGPRSSSRLVFSQDDLNYLLRGNDYPPHWRPYLADISFRVIESEQVKSLFNTGLINKAETIERYQDVGYKQKDATLLTDLIARENEWKQIQRSQSRMRFKAINAYRTGTLSRADAEVILYELSLPTLQKYDEFAAKPLQERHDIARLDNSTEIALNNVDIDLTATLAKTAIGAIKKAFLHLEINAQQAMTNLTRIGVTQTRVTQYLDKWQWEFYGRGKTLAVGQVLKSVVRGYMLPQVAVQRLILLGYSNVDAFALVSMASEDRIAFVARAQAALARKRGQQQKALLALNTMLKKELRDNQAKLARSASRAKLVKWFVDEQVPESEYSLRLALLGVSKEDIQHEYEEAIAKRQSKPKSKKAAAAGT